MKLWIHNIAVVTLLCICMIPPAWGQQYLLYSPQPVASGQKTSSQEGVLVQEIEVKKGDTLFALSRKFSGYGMYFPQILLFNSIKNPNLIYPGNTLRIPVDQKPPHDSGRTETKSTLKTESESSTRQSARSAPVSSPNTELALSDIKTAGPGKSQVNRKKNKTTGHAKKSPAQVYSTKASPTQRVTNKDAETADIEANATDGQKLFEAATKAYRRDDCNTALELLDRYLVENASSPLAADATLYKAECYLKLSAQ